MTLLELVKPRPDWFGALEVALTRPPGVPERRAGEDPWAPAPPDRPKRIADDLIWLRRAIDEPEQHGLKPISDSAAVAVWEPRDGACERLDRLGARGVLDAGGFLLHQPDALDLH